MSIIGVHWREVRTMGRSEKSDIAKKVEALGHIQAAVDILVDAGTQDSLNAWRYVKSARNALAEDIWTDARHTED